jgi:DNA-directed RNA polymerase specialized sigma24 family protein
MDPQARSNANAAMCRLADGDRGAFDEIYLALWPVLRDFCRRVLPPEDAEDAAQQALLKVFSQASNYDRTRDALTWALAVSAWEVRTLRKRRSRSRTVGLEEHDAESPLGRPDTLTEDTQLLTAALQVLGTLSVSDQQTLRAALSEEAPEALAGATFRKRKERALTRLREAWRTLYGN